jgi:carbonic anhydrase
MFDDLLEANEAYQASFDLQGLRAGARRGLALLTCIDSRIEPLSMLGLEPGDAKILRNAGARVTIDVLRSLALATNLLGVTRICIVHHTDCRVASASEAEIHDVIASARGVDTEGWDFLAVEDLHEVVRHDVDRLRQCPLLPPDVEVGAFLYDVQTGALNPLGTGDTDRGADEISRP